MATVRMKSRRSGEDLRKIIKTPRFQLPPVTPQEAGDAALVVRFVRFMDDLVGAGNWEQREGEDQDHAVVRQALWYAFKAGAGVD